MITSLTDYRCTYGWLDKFWDFVTPKGQLLEVATLTDDGVHPRDAMAHARVWGRLCTHPGVRFTFYPPWVGQAVSQPLVSGQNVLFIARPRLYFGSRLSTPAKLLEAQMLGEFDDPKSGRAGDAIVYEKHRFSRRLLEELRDGQRRCDRDFGLLLHRQEEISGHKVGLSAICGIGALGTLGLAILLADDFHRGKLREQAQEIAPWNATHRPDLHLELLVEIEVDGDEGLRTLLGRLDGSSLSFRYQVRAVAFAASDAPKICLRSTRPLLQIEANPNGKPGGRVRLDEDHAWVPLTKTLFGPLRLILEHPQQATTARLCEELRFPGGAKRLAKRIFDLNKILNRELFGDRKVNVVHFSHKLKHYVVEVR